MSLSNGDAISLIAVLFSFVLSVVSITIAVRAMAISKTANLFSSFDVASQMAIQFPKTMALVHGIDDNEEEVRAIAYLSQLLDGFQHFHEERDGGYNKMLNDKSTFLDKLMANPANVARWNSIKHANYGDRDQGFILAIEALIERGQTANDQ